MHSNTAPPRRVFSLLCLIGIGVGTLSAQNLTALNDYSVVVSGNFSTNSDVEGRTLVGGNLTSGSSANFGIRLQNQVPKTDLTLRVGGDIVSGNPLQLNAGSLELGGSLNGRHINYNGGGSLISNPGVSHSSVIDALVLASDTLSQLDANSNFSVNGSQPGPFRFNAAPDSDGIAIFLVDGNTLFNNQNVQQIELLANGASDILINVSGTNINWQHGNMVGLFTQNSWRESIVWNFYEAEVLNFGSKNMMGQVLAPNASVTTQGNIDGSIFAKNLTTTSEVHLPGYNGNIAIPEPSSMILVASAAIGLLLRRKRD